MKIYLCSIFLFIFVHLLSHHDQNACAHDCYRCCLITEGLFSRESDYFLFLSDVQVVLTWLKIYITDKSSILISFCKSSWPKCLRSWLPPLLLNNGRFIFRRKWLLFISFRCSSCVISINNLSLEKNGRTFSNFPGFQQVRRFNKPPNVGLPVFGNYRGKKTFSNNLSALNYRTITEGKIRSNIFLRFWQDGQRSKQTSGNRKSRHTIVKDNVGVAKCSGGYEAKGWIEYGKVG